MDSLKVMLALIIFSSGVYRIYTVFIEGMLSTPVVLRGANGFLLDEKPPLVVGPEEVERFLKQGQPLKKAKLPSLKEQKQMLQEELKSSTSPEDEMEKEKVINGKEINEDTPAVSSADDTSVSPDSEATPEALDPKKVYYSVNCQARNTAGRMPKVVWNRLVEKSGKFMVTVKTETDLTQVSLENFGGEQCWPKLWSLNPGIENPHRVPAGTEIRFREAMEKDSE